MNLGFSANQGSVIALSGVYHLQRDFSALSLWIRQLKKQQTEIIWGGELCPKEERGQDGEERSLGWQLFPGQLKDLEGTFNEVD